MRGPAGGGCRIINELNCVEGIVLHDYRMHNTGNIQNAALQSLRCRLCDLCVGVFVCGCVGEGGCGDGEKAV